MENVFLLSGDLTHKWHVNTLVTSIKETNTLVHWVICQNQLKSNALFTLKQRKKDFIITLLANEKFQELDIDPYEIVHTAEDENEIVNIINHSKKVVRWIRNEDDLNYIQQLLRTYNIKDWFNKAHLVQVPKELQHISSSKHKYVLQSFLKEYDHIPRPYMAFITKSDFLRFKNMPLIINSVSNETRELLMDDYIDFFERLEKIKL